ncbi:MAG: hypothetical protein R3318_02085 [Gammaproteobacteria bacterium]|nr:hypothetical protein [Gammaproteobacteria bacterium]
MARRRKGSRSTEDPFKDEYDDDLPQKAGPLKRYFVIGVLVVVVITIIAWEFLSTGIETDLVFLGIILAAAVIFKVLRLS